VPDLSSCVRCTRPVPPDAPGGSCPACLLALALETPAGAGDPTGESVVAPTVTAAPAGASVTVSLRGPKPGRWPVVPGYAVLGELGAGGGGAVYRARQRVADREVAVKVVRAGANRDRFEREVRTLAALDHPHVVRVYEVGESDHGPFFSMELLPGGSLAARIRRAGPLDPAEAAAVVEKAAGGVAAAHARNVLHRDLKPSNVLLNEAGEPKVADFGLAKEWLPDPESSTADPATPSGAFLGTPAYAAPEQAAGRAAEHDARTDVYGLGAVLYQALTGDPPFAGENTAVVLHRVLTADPDPLRVRRRAVPPELEAVCLKCLAKDPDDRYESAAAVAADLGRWRRGEPTEARPPGPAGRARRWARRHATLVRGTAVTALVAVLVGVVAAAPWRTRRPEPDPPEPPEVAVERQAARIEVALDRRDPVVLIGDTGGPAWSNWVAQTDPNPAPPPVGSGFSVQSWGYALVELVRDPRHRAYRLTAEVRHLESHEVGSVGLYVGRVETPTAAGPVHQLVELSFNDIVPPWAPNRPNGTPFVFPDMDKTPVALAARGFAPRGAELPWLPSFVTFDKRLCRPAGLGKTGWRRLALTVTPDAVRATWDGDPNQEVVGPLADLAAATARWRADAARRPAGPPWADAVRPAFRPRGGAGVYVFRGSAAFRSVVIEPLPGGEDS
jgi:eukaryotic-like serine/threonine-protein kinase